MFLLKGELPATSAPNVDDWSKLVATAFNKQLYFLINNTTGYEQTLEIVNVGWRIARNAMWVFKNLCF